MRLRFTKMHGAGNDFVVLDATRVPLQLSDAQFRALADRRTGVGADQILIVDPAPTPDVDFGYRIHNSSGEEVEHCGNGARCFLRYVHEHGLSSKSRLRVQTVNNLLELQLQADGRVTVDMNRPIFEHARIPFDSQGLKPRAEGDFECWPLALDDGTQVMAAVLSMGNPHAVMRVGAGWGDEPHAAAIVDPLSDAPPEPLSDSMSEVLAAATAGRWPDALRDTPDVAHAPVAHIGPWVERHARFPRHINAGFVQVVSRSEARLRVYERGAGETLACGTGACAAVVAGIRLGWFDPVVEVHTRGGDLKIEWHAHAGPGHVFMTGPATTVFEGEIEL